MASPWKKITNTPPFSVDTMPLLTDGSVMCHEYETVKWRRRRLGRFPDQLFRI